MSKILVGRNNPKEVEIGSAFTKAKRVETDESEQKESGTSEYCDERPQDEVQGEVQEPEQTKQALQTPSKGRGKKRSKA